MLIKMQRFFVLGISKSGYFAAKYILSEGGECFLYDENHQKIVREKIDELKSLGAIEITADDIEKTLSTIDALVVSPGIPINHPIVVLAKKSGVRIMGELQFGFSCFNPPFIAVTGTNGKTTTVSMIKKIFEQAGKSVFAVGNFGIPVTEKINEISADDNPTVICEVSSFQLETISDFKPHVACVLNVTPDHLERHYTMENYIFLKKRMLKNLMSTEFAVLNYDDPVTAEFAAETSAKALWISIGRQTNGAYVSEGKIYCFGEFVMDKNDLSLKEVHNVYNALFAITVARLYGISLEAIKAALSEFKGVSHRMELVYEENGVKFYDDSKATNTASAISAVSSASEPFILILGGSEKGESYDNLFKEIKNNPLVKHVVLTGAAGVKMLECAGSFGVGNITYTRDFKRAVLIAKFFAKEGYSVYLSPACASFDDFSGYEERGDFYKAIIEGKA